MNNNITISDRRDNFLEDGRMNIIRVLIRFSTLYYTFNDNIIIKRKNKNNR